MSQSVPPPPGDPSGNPFAPGPHGPGPQGAPFAPGVPLAPAPVPVRRNPGLGIAAGVAAALVAAIAYGLLAGSIEREFGYAALGVGALIGFAANKAGGRHPLLPFAAAVLAPAAVYLGQLIGLSMVLAEFFKVPFSEVFFEQFGAVRDAWSEEADFGTYSFMAVGALVAFVTARRSD
ncbi:hypothetical protein ACH4E8_04380 [Streptomyces sp. NPDC017979]|uniref:hypothetical protein n=1 Tax=Streptomyces sp. NPDC017979 TaxID=3365024 RepID=UPI0037BC1CC0